MAHRGSRLKYTIISLNDDRKHYKDNIRKNVVFEEMHVPAYNANEHHPFEGIALRGLNLDPIWPNAKRGELGVWLSNYDRWKLVSTMEEPLIVFEDDAIVDNTFSEKFDAFVRQLPNGWDFAALWVPENQRQDFRYNLTYDWAGNPIVKGMLPAERSLFAVPNSDRVALVYQGYGMVSLMYSPQGGKKLVSLAKQYGITGPVDCWIYEQAHMGNLNGYAPRPEHAEIVTYDWSATSHVQLTERAL